MVEQRSPKPPVVGSSPSSPATNFWKRIFRMNKIKKYIQEAKIEIEKVIFPTKNEIKQSFMSVFVVVAVISLFLSGVDLIMSAILKSVL